MPSQRFTLKAASDKELADINNLLTELGKKAAAIGVDLTPKERKSLPRFGNRSYTFVEDALSIGQQHPEMLPPSLDIKKFAESFQLYLQTQHLVATMKTLLDHFVDTNRASGAYIYEAARAVYDAAKAGAKLKKPGVGAMAKDLGQRFKKKTRPKLS